MIVAAGETPLDAPRNAQSHTEPKNDVTEMINPVKCGLHVNEREKNQGQLVYSMEPYLTSIKPMAVQRKRC
ncbi:uncharacterized protein LOC143215108 isoform X4 [Lasioglossum baleicum]|uniref:uncharacterized protein LOC143215108 isoform X4 n=1 Tax=Lasioglossum baleicum TaxID=434251 RepID=UPI003FCCA5A8